MVSSSLGCCASKPASWNLSGRAVMLLQRLGSLLLLWEMKFLTCDHCSHWRGESILGDLSFHLFLPLKEFFESFSSPFLWCRDLGAHLGSRGHWNISHHWMSFCYYHSSCFWRFCISTGVESMWAWSHLISHLLLGLDSQKQLVWMRSYSNYSAKLSSRTCPHVHHGSKYPSTIKSGIQACTWVSLGVETGQ